MAVQNINYENKEALQNDANIPDKNKVTDADMNEIKNVVNNNASELTATQGNVKSLEGKTTSNEGNITALSIRVSTLEADNTKNKNDIKEMKTKNSEQDTKLDDLSNNKVDKIEGKGLSTNDFTNEDKSKLDSLENYDDAKIKQDIEKIQAKNTEQDKSIEQNTATNTKQDELIQKLKDNCINVTTEEATQLHIKDASTLPAVLSVRGNHYQKVTETAENIFDGKLELGAWDYTSGEKVENSSQMRNVDYIDVSGQTQITIVKKEAGTFTVEVRYYADDKSFIGRASINNATDAITTTIINNLDPSKTVKYATLTFTHSTDTNEIFGVNKGADLTWHDFIPNSPSLDYPSPVRAVGDNVNIFDKDNMNKILATPSKLTIIASSSGGASFYLEVKPNTDYTISRKIVGQRFLAATSVEVPAVGGTLTQNVPNNTGDGIHIKTGKNDKYLLVYYLYSNSENEEEILSSIKIEEGTEATSYSPYGQGSVEIKKINKNFFDKDTVQFYNNNSSAFENTDNNVPTRLRTSSFEIKEGSYVSSGLSSTINLIAVRAYNENKEYMSDGSERTGNNFTLKQGVEYIHLLFSKSDNSNISKEEVSQLDIQIEKGNIASDYAKHEESNYILDIQQPMLSGDYFVKEADGWKEVHGWNKHEFTGEENITYHNAPNIDKANTASTAYFTIDLPKSGENDATKKGNVFCNCFSNLFDAIDLWANSDNEALSKEAVSLQEILRIRINKTRLTNYSNDMTSTEKVNLMKQYLTEIYNTGNPIYVYYKLATPTKLPCTEAQSNVLDQLNELGLFAGTNNIITAEGLALLQMRYIADTETYIDNRIDEKLANINQQLLEIVGGK